MITSADVCLWRGNLVGTDNVVLNQTIKSLMQRLSCVHTYGPLTNWSWIFFFFFFDALSPYISFSPILIVLEKKIFRTVRKSQKKKKIFSTNLIQKYLFFQIFFRDMIEEYKIYFPLIRSLGHFRIGLGPPRIITWNFYLKILKKKWKIVTHQTQPKTKIK